MNNNVLILARRALAAVLLTPLVLAAGACSSSGSDDTKAAASTNATEAKSSSMASGITPSNTWAKAADRDMTAAFGTLKNTGSRPVTITGATGDAGPVQLHVTQKTANGMEMRETKAFTIPAGGSLDLKPGGSHLMFMNLSKALKAGDDVQLAVAFQDGSKKTISFPVRAYDGAKEKYSDGASHHASSMSDMPDMSSSHKH